MTHPPENTKSGFHKSASAGPFCLRPYFSWLLSFVLTLVSFSKTSSQEAGIWPCFHGSDRTNQSAETGLQKAWNENGPALLFTIQGLGEGYSSTAIYDGMIYTAGSTGNRSYLYAFDLNGKLLWKKPNGDAWSVKVSWASSYNGPRSTPTCDNGVVYMLSEAGMLSAFRAKTGEVIWSRNLPREFNAAVPMYGYSESVLIDDDNLYVRTGNQKAYQACLSKRTGKTIWTSGEIPGDYGYNSMVISDFGGFHQVIGATNTCYYSLDARNGRLLWKADFMNRYEINCSDAITFKDYVFLTSGEGKGCMLIRLKKTGSGITTEKVWETKYMDNYHGGVILFNGYLYGSGSMARDWYCLDFITGKLMWRTNGSGSLTYADGMLYLYDEKGIMKLVKASPDKFEKTGEFRVPEGGLGPYWAHPVVCGGRLYLRHADKIFVYDIRQQ
jgi:outer membrane protein assembly factor BamB